MEPMHDELSRIAPGSLVIAGALDEAGLERARFVADAMPDARLEVIDRAGHAPHMERPAEFNALLTSFLGPADPPH